MTHPPSAKQHFNTDTLCWDETADWSTGALGDIIPEELPLFFGTEDQGSQDVGASLVAT